mmetsp:Transcript_20009/g.46172  ORF Transcript_20009/g.46172 Transcript_20009/m.46172 type:complete len:208 (+) Transcript_20009:257-880(+)
MLRLRLGTKTRRHPLAAVGDATYREGVNDAHGVLDVQNGAASRQIVPSRPLVKAAVLHPAVPATCAVLQKQALHPSCRTLVGQEELVTTKRKTCGLTRVLAEKVADSQSDAGPVGVRVVVNHHHSIWVQDRPCQLHVVEGAVQRVAGVHGEECHLLRAHRVMGVFEGVMGAMMLLGCVVQRKQIRNIRRGGLEGGALNNLGPHLLPL